MLQATRLRSQHQERQHQQPRRQKATGGRYHCRPVPKLFLLIAALGSAIDRTGASNSHRSPPPTCFVGRGGSSSRRSSPPVPEPLSLGDRVRNFGDKFRRDGGSAGGLEGGSSSSSGSSSRGKRTRGKAMAGAGAAGGRDDGVAQGASNGQRKASGGNSFIAGGLAGSISTTVTCPIEVSFATQRLHYRGVVLVCVCFSRALSRVNTWSCLKQPKATKSPKLAHEGPWEHSSRDSKQMPEHFTRSFF